MRLTHLCKRVCLSVHPFVGPSVRRSVHPLRLCKNRVSGLCLASVRSYTDTNDRQTCFESLLYYSVVSSVSSSICLSIHVTCSIHAETQSGRIILLPGRACLRKHASHCALSPSEAGVDFESNTLKDQQRNLNLNV